MATSTLNPNAPIFVPSAYLAVEDFSDEWWDLVQSAPWFRDYWLRECFYDPQITPPLLENTKVKEGQSMDLVSLGWLKWRKPRVGGASAAETSRFFEKTPKIVSIAMNRKPIHQPRVTDLADVEDGLLQKWKVKGKRRPRMKR